MKNSIKILSLLIAILMIVSVFVGCSKKEEGKNDRPTDADETETEIVTDQYGETSIVIIHKEHPTDAADGTDDVVTDENGETVKNEKNESGDVTVSAEDGTKKPTDGAEETTGKVGKDTVAAESTGKGEKETAVGTKKPGGDNGDVTTAKKPTGSKETTSSETGKVVEIQGYVPEKKDPDKAQLPDGIKLGDVSISRLEDTVSIDIKVENTKDYDQIVDFSYLVMKINDKDEILNTFSVVPINGKSISTCSMPIEDESVDLSIGQSVTVYYGNDLIATVTVGIF